MSCILFFSVFVLMPFSTGGADFGMSKNSENYGPYIVEWEHSGTCRGPKSINMSEYSIVMFRNPDDTYRCTLNVTFPENVQLEEIRFKINTLKDGKKSILWNVNVNKPCQHYMLASMLESYFGVKNCWIKKGLHVADLPLTELMIKYIGESFFYGNYLFKVVAISKKANLGCLVFDPKFKKKISH